MYLSLNVAVFVLHHYLGVCLIEGVFLSQIFAQKRCAYLGGVLIERGCSKSSSYGILNFSTCKHICGRAYLLGVGAYIRGKNMLSENKTQISVS